MDIPCSRRLKAGTRTPLVVLLQRCATQSCADVPHWPPLRPTPAPEQRLDDGEGVTEPEGGSQHVAAARAAWVKALGTARFQALVEKVPHHCIALPVTFVLLAVCPGAAALTARCQSTALVSTAVLAQVMQYWQLFSLRL
jgi:hypothetical protein